MEQQAIKEVPYGVSDFVRVMTQNMYYAEFINNVISAETAVDKLNLINDESKKQGYPFYLIIDEYDNYGMLTIKDTFGDQLLLWIHTRE